MGHSGRHRTTRFQLGDVLAGRVVPSAQEIIQHIHQVNPTGQELPRPEAERRYGIKTKLQSLLVRQYKDALVVVRDDAEEDSGIVLLRHRLLGVAAGHAVVDNLDEEARSWVQGQIDRGLAETSAETAPPGPWQHRRATRSHDDPPSSLEASMDEGYRALEAYDYLAAREAFEQARALAPQAARPMGALLDLLVYQLGLDGDALALAEERDPHLLAHPEVRAPLALAAARAGEHALAEQWVAELEGERAAEIHRTLAGAALQAGDLAGAHLRLQLARQAFAPDPEQLALENRLGEAQALAARPLETALQEELARADGPAAEALARRILQIHPASSIARQVLKEAGLRRRQAEQKAELAEVHAAIDRGDGKRARQLLEGVRGLAIDQETLAALREAIQRSEDARAREREQREMEEVVQALAQSTSSRDLEAALERYGGLAPPRRAEVRKRSERRELAWLDEIAAHEEEARLTKLIPALCAMGAAEEALAAGDLDAARATLAPHRALLRHFRRGRDVVTRLSACEAESRRRQAEDLLARAKQAMAEGDDAQAASLVQRIQRQDLHEAQATEAETLSRRLNSARSLRSAEATIDQCLAVDDLIGARSLLLCLLGTRIEPRMQAWSRLLAEVEAHMRQAWVVLDEQPVGLHAGHAPEMALTGKIPAEAQIGLLPVADSADFLAIFASVQEGLLFVRVVDVTSNEIRRLLVLRLPENEMAVSIGVADHCVWIVDVDAHYVEISCHDWLPRHERFFKAHVSDGQYLEAGLAVPQERALSLAIGDTTDPDKCWVRVVDRSSNQLLRTAEQECDFHRIAGVTPPLLARLNHQDRVRLVGARGYPVRDLILPEQGMLLGIATAPSGQGYLALTRSLVRRQPILVVTGLNEHGIPNSSLELSANPDLSVRMASIPSRQIACICYHEATTNEGRIAYLRAEGEDHGGKLRVSAIVPTHGSCEMLQDEASTTCVAVRRTRGGVVLTRLDEAPTEFPDCAVPCTNLPRTTWPLWCPLTPDPTLETKLRQQFTFEHQARLGPEATARWIADRMASLASSTTSSLCFYRFLRVEKRDAEADELLSGLQGQFPDNPYVQLAMIERDASLGRWTGGELLERSREAMVREHLHHLHALVCLHDNRFEDAVWILSEAPKGAGCGLADILDLARALRAGRSADAPPVGAAPGGLRELVRTILWADHHVEEGDTESARRLLDQAWIREVGEVQSLARLALIYLAAPPDPAALFRSLALMADFVDANLVDGYACNLWLGKNTWDRVRVNEVFTRARARLDEVRGSGRTDAQKLPSVRIGDGACAPLLNERSLDV